METTAMKFMALEKYKFKLPVWIEGNMYFNGAITLRK